MISKSILPLVALASLLFSAAAHSADWYRWRGPDLNGVSSETGWQSKWPDEGPKRLWKSSVGTGFSSMTVSDGRVYTMGNTGGTDTIFCLDAATGAAVWKHSYPCDLDPKFFEGGPTATPTVDGSRVYTLSRKGDLFCLDAAKGTVLWTTNAAADLGFEIPTWGFSGSALVDGDLAIFDIGSAGLALDKKTGAVKWSSAKTVAGYSTPVAFNTGTTHSIAILGAKSLDVVNPADGKSLSTYPWKTEYDVNAADPIISNGKIFITSGYGHGCALLELGSDKVLWQNKNLRDKFNNAVLWKGYIYSADEGNQLKCVSWETGEVKWSEKTFGSGQLLIADGKIIGLGEKGELLIADATPDAFKPISRTQVLGGKCWTAPVLSNGRIYCRNAKGDLVCLDLSGK